MISDALPATPPPESSDEGRTDELYRVLGHHRRRTVLRELHRADARLTVDELARRVAGREHERADDDRADGDISTVRLSLHHRHLPKLAASNVVAYDPSNRTVGFRTLTGEW